MINYLATIIPIYFPQGTFDNVSPEKTKAAGWIILSWLSFMVIGALVSALIVKPNDDRFIDAMAGIVVATLVWFIVVLLGAAIYLVL